MFGVSMDQQTSMELSHWTKLVVVEKPIIEPCNMLSMDIFAAFSRTRVSELGENRILWSLNRTSFTDSDQKNYRISTYTISVLSRTMIIDKPPGAMVMQWLHTPLPPLTSAVQTPEYKTLTNCMYWFPLPFQLPVMI